MARLSAVSDLGDSSRGPAALGHLLTASPFISFLDAQSAFEVDATEFEWRPDDEAATLQTRDIGEGYTAAAQEPTDKLTGELAFHGDAITVDKSHVADDQRGLRDLQGWLDKRLTKLFPSWSKLYENKLFNGAGTSGALKGLKVIFDGTTFLPGYGITGVITPTGNSLNLADSANDDYFLELLQMAISEVENPTGIPVNKELHARIASIARRTNNYGQTKDQFGNVQDTIMSVPLIKCVDGTILNTEPDGAGTPVNNTTSLWIMGPGEMKASLVTNSGLYFREEVDLETIVGSKVEWEIRGQWKIEAKNAIRRVRRLKV